MSALQVGVVEPGIPEAGGWDVIVRVSFEIGILELRFSQVGSVELSPFQVGPLEVRGTLPGCTVG